MIPPGVRVIYWDAVGTLIFPDPSPAEIYAEVAKRHGSRLTASEIAPRFRAAFQGQEEIDLRRDLRTSEAREVERWRLIVGEVLDDVNDPERCFRKLFAHFAQPHGWRCDPEAAQVLEELAERGYTLGMASNYDARLHSVVAGLSELRRIQHLAISSEVGWRKPAVEFFTALGALAQRPLSEILHVGDDRVNDYQGARQAGLHALLLDSKQSAAKVDGVHLHRLSDLLDR